MDYKVIKQHDQKDCGAACLATIANYYGYKSDFSNFVRITETDKHGTNMNSLVEAARKMGFEADGLEGSMEELLEGIRNKSIVFPFIAHIITEEKTLHFVVVFEIKGDVLVVGDPGRGLYEITINDFKKLWTGCIILLSPSKNFKKGRFGRSKAKTFLWLFNANKKMFFVVTLLSFLVVTMGIVGTFVFQATIDGFYTNAYDNVQEHNHEDCDESCEEDHTNVSENETKPFERVLNSVLDVLDDIASRISMSDFNLFFVLLLMLYLFCALIHYWRGRLLVYVAKNIDITLGELYYKKIVDMSVAGISERKTGEYLSRFSDLSAIRNAISSATITIILDSLLVVFCGVILFLLEKTLFFISLSLIVFYAIVAIVCKKPLDNSNRKLMENNAIFTSYLKESIDGNELIKSSCSQKTVNGKLNSLFTSFIDATVLNGKVIVAQDTLCNTIESVGMVLILWVGFFLVNNSTLTLGALLTFYALRTYFTEPIKNIISLQPTIQTALVAMDRFFDVLDMEAEDVTDGKSISIATDWKKISASEVSFEYKNSDVIIERMNFVVHRGEKIALVGESGCGKTTFAKLMLNFFEPTEGGFYIDDVSYDDFSKEEIRRNIAYVSQEMFFFTDSLRNNLILGNVEITDDEIMKICTVCKLDEFINELPYGLDTPIEENGSNLSAGQRQRLALVRAILREPKLLIMDEVTSNLDTVTEKAIKEFVFGNSDLTCIMIAHRLSTIKQCDRIYVMKNGTVAEYGSHLELMEKRGLYYDMVQAQ